MKNIIQKKHEFILPLIGSIIYFIAIKQIIPHLFYAVFAIFLSLYYFPLKLILNNNDFEYYGRNNLMRIISYILISILSALSIIILINNNLELINIFKILAIINFLLLIYFSFKNYDRSIILLHFGLMIFTSAIVGI